MKNRFKRVIALVVCVGALCIGASANSLEDVIKNNESAEETTVATETTDDENYANGSDIGKIAENAKIEIDTEGTKKYTNPLSKVVGKFVSIATTVILLMAIVMSIMDIVYITFPFMRPYLRSENSGNVYKENPQTNQPELSVTPDPRMRNQVSCPAHQPTGGNSRRINICSDIAVKSVMNAESSRSNVYMEYFKKMWGMYPAIVILIVLTSSGIMYKVGFQVADWLITGIKAIMNNINNGI